MANINDFRDKVVGALGIVADKTKDVAGKAADTAKSLSRITKLTVEIGSEKETIKKAYIEIGKLYYDMHKNDPDGFFAQLCDEVTLAYESIAQKEAEIAELKETMPWDGDDDTIIVDFEEVVSEAEAAAEAPVETPAESAPESAPDAEDSPETPE